MFPKIDWPDGKDFAFTIFDDSDQDTIENLETVHPFLRDLSFRTTKAVWPTPRRRYAKAGWGYV